MSKINLIAIDKLIKTKSSSIEIDLLLYLANISSDFGTVRNLYYKDVCLHLNISFQSFYSALDRLYQHKLIYISNYFINSPGAWNITILDNIYLNDDHYKKGYINTNRFSNLFFSNSFRKLPVNIKYLILKLLKVQRENENIKRTFNKLKEYASIKSNNILLNYINIISQFFNVKLKGQLYYIRIKEEFNTPSKYTDQELFLTNKIKNWCRLYKINYTLKDLKEILQLFKQYPNKIPKLVHILWEISTQYKSLEYKLINKKVSQA